jgi:hypothetical protein
MNELTGSHEIRMNKLIKRDQESDWKYQTQLTHPVGTLEACGIPIAKLNNHLNKNKHKNTKNNK